MNKTKWVPFSLNIHPEQMKKLNDIYKRVGQSKSVTVRDALELYFKTKEQN